MKYQYTIKGKVITGPGIDDSAGYLATLGIAVGSSVVYKFIIDLSSPGFIKMSDATINPAPIVGSFYVKFISGTTWTPATHNSSYNNIAEQNYGNPNWQKLYPPFGERAISPSNGNNYLMIKDMLQQPNSKDHWPVGSSFGSPAMLNVIYDASGNKSSFAFDAKITNVVFVS